VRVRMPRHQFRRETGNDSRKRSERRREHV
jgi:hypothetical protein